MFGIFLQKNKVVLLTAIIASVITAGASLSYAAIKNKKEASDRKIEALQKSIEDLQMKNEQSAKAEEPEKISIEAVQQAETSEIASQKKVTGNKILESTSEKTQPKDTVKDEPLVKCLSYDGSVAELSANDCEILKQSNAVFEKIVDEYKKCVSDAENRFQDRLNTGYDSSMVTAYNKTAQACALERNNQVNKFQKNFKK